MRSRADILLLPRVCNGELLEALKGSLLGGSLPSLASALMFLSGSVLSAERLLPSLKKLNASLDLMTSALPQMAKADAIYLAEERRRRITGQRSDHHLPWLLSLQKTMILLESRMASCLIWNPPNSSLFDESFDANATADGCPSDSHTAKNNDFGVDRFSMLFAGGIETNVLDRVRAGESAAQAVATAKKAPSTNGATPTLTTRRTSQLKPKKSFKQKASSMWKMFYDMGLTRDGCACFVSEFIRGVNSAGEVASWLEEALIRRDTNYKIASKQFRSTNKTPLLLGSLEKAERTLVAAIMKHEGLLPLAIGFANAMQKTPEKDWTRVEPPVVLVSTWRAAGNLRQWLLRQRGEFVSSVGKDKRRLFLVFREHGENVTNEGKSKPSSFSDLVKSATLALQMLLCFRPADCGLSAGARTMDRKDREAHSDKSLLSVGLDLPCNPPSILCSNTETLTGSFVSYCSARYGNVPFLQRHKQSRWKIVRTYFHTIFRWKTLARDSKDARNCAKRNVVGLLPLSPYSVDALDFCKKSHNDETVLQHSVATSCWSAVMKSQETGIRRAVGLASLVRILRTTSLASAREDVLECLIPVLSYVNTSNKTRNSSNDTVGCNEAVIQEIRSSYYHLFEWATDELERRTKERGRNQYVMAELRGNRYFLLLLELWSVPLTLGDYQHVAKLGIFEILERIVVSTFARQSQTKTRRRQKNANGHRRLMSFGKERKSSIYPVEVVGAAWRLLRLILANLASASQLVQMSPSPTTTMKASISVSALRSFKRPTALDNLFDVLFNFSLEESYRILPSAYFSIFDVRPEALKSMSILLHGAQCVEGMCSPVIKDSLSSSGTFSVAFWIQLRAEQNENDEDEDEDEHEHKSRLEPIIQLGSIENGSSGCSLFVCKRGRRLAIVVRDAGGKITKHNSVSALEDHSTSTHSTEQGAKATNSVEAQWWSHVALSVNRGGLVCVYVNGVVDLKFTLGNEGTTNTMQGTVVFGNFEERNLQDSFRTKDDAVVSCCKSVIGDVIMNSTPIDERTAKALCSGGPPELAVSPIHDKELYQVWVALKLLVSCPIGRCALSSRKWLQLLMTYVQCGSLRLQQLSLRILSDLVSHDPSVFGEIAESVWLNAEALARSEQGLNTTCNGSFLTAFLLRNQAQMHSSKVPLQGKSIALFQWFLRSAGHLLHPLHRFDPSVLQNTHRNEMTEPEERAKGKPSKYEESSMLASEIIYFLRSVMKGDANSETAARCLLGFKSGDVDLRRVSLAHMCREHYLDLLSKMGSIAGEFAKGCASEHNKEQSSTLITFIPFSSPRRPHRLASRWIKCCYQPLKHEWYNSYN